MTITQNFIRKSEQRDSNEHKIQPKTFSMFTENAPEHIQSAISNSCVQVPKSLMHGVTFHYSNNIQRETAFQMPNDCNALFEGIISPQMLTREYCKSGSGRLKTTAYYKKNVKS